MLERNTPDISSLNRLDSATHFTTQPQPYHGGMATPIPYQSTPHQQPRERRYLSSFFLIGLTVITVFLAIVLWEKNAPYEYKISVQLGTFSGTTAAAMLEAQQKARLEFEGLMKQQQEIMQTNVAKQQTELQMLSATLQAKLQQVNGAYSAMYQRGNMIAQSVAQAQQQFLNLRQQLAASGQGGTIAAANMAGFIGGFVDVLGGDKNLANQFYNKADELNRRNRSSFDESASTPAPFIQIQGWNNGLPSPDEFMNMTNDVALKMIEIGGQQPAAMNNPFEKRSYNVTPSKF